MVCFYVSESFIIVSYSHTTEAVYTFTSVLFHKLSENYTSIRTLVFSDGVAFQFKRWYLFSNLHSWEKKFSIGLTWYFFATSHGKGSVDGIGGTVNRSVWRATHAGSTVPCDAASNAEFAAKM